MTLLLTLVLAATAPAPPPAEPGGPPASRKASMPAPARVANARADAASDDDDLDDDADDEIVVSGTRPRGAVATRIPPEIQLGARAIRALGADSLDEVFDELAPQARSIRGGGAPVVLLDGRRISSLAEVRDLPPEAIRRIDVFPEEVALQYGFAANQRVVNVVLRRRYRAIGVQARYALADRGGRTTYRGRANILRLGPEGRWSLDALYQHEDAVRDDADTDEDVAGAPRTLAPRTDRVAANGTFSRNIGAVAAALNGRIEGERARSNLGATVDGGGGVRAVGRVERERSLHAGLSLNGSLTGWQWTLTANGDARRRNVLTRGASAAPAGTTVSYRSDSDGWDADLIANGPVLSLPAGPLTASLGVGAETRDLDVALAPAIVGKPLPARWITRGHASLELPLASRQHGVLGELSGNANLRAARTTAFGTLVGGGVGLRWQPLPAVSLVVAAARNRNVPEVALLGNPALLTPNVRVYDFPQRRLASIDFVDGGSRGLAAERQGELSVRMQARPVTGLSASIDYVRRRTAGAILESPGATPQLEAALPGRFIRDRDASLIGFDGRPLNLARRDGEQIRSGINLVKRLSRGASAPGSADEAMFPEQAAPQPGSADQFQFALYHTWHLRERARVTAGSASLDLLNGDALRRGGGEPRHELELQAGIASKGLGIRLSGAWQTDTTVRDRLSGGAPSDTLLTFSRTPTIGLRLFVDPGSQPWFARRVPWLRGRINLVVNNILDGKVRVRAADGRSLGRFGRDGDAPGRSLRLTFRKVFRSR